MSWTNRSDPSGSSFVTISLMVERRSSFGRQPPMRSLQAKGKGRFGISLEMALKLPDSLAQITNISTEVAKDAFKRSFRSDAHNPANFIPKRIHSGMVIKPISEVPTTMRTAVGGSPP